MPVRLFDLGGVGFARGLKTLVKLAQGAGLDLHNPVDGLVKYLRRFLNAVSMPIGQAVAQLDDASQIVREGAEKLPAPRVAEPLHHLLPLSLGESVILHMSSHPDKRRVCAISLNCAGEVRAF